MAELHQRYFDKEVLKNFEAQTTPTLTRVWEYSKGQGAGACFRWTNFYLDPEVQRQPEEKVSQFCSLL